MFDLDQIKQLAGSRFSLGKKLFENGKVSRLQIKDGVVTAKVRGQQSYDVLLQDGDPILNSCTCPAADHQDFCKHCVAVALAAQEPEATTEGAEDKLRQWFQFKPANELAEIIMELLEADEAAYEKWHLKFKASTTSFSFAELKKLVTKALPKRDLWEWDKVSNYFAKAEGQLNSVYEAMTPLDVEKRWKLLAHILKRLNEVLERVDDSGGARFGTEQELFEQMKHQFQQLQWSDSKKATWLVELLDNQDYMLAPSVTQFFHSESLHGAFLIQCEQTLSEHARDPNYNQWRLRVFAEPLLEKAAETDNLKEQVRLHALVAHSVEDYLKICQLCLDHEEELDAEDWLLRAKKLVRTTEEKRICQGMEVSVHLALGEKEQAWQTCWQLFISHPTLEGYLALEQLEKQTGVMDEHYEAACEELLKGRYEEPKGSRGVQRFDDILAFYLHRNELSKALKWATVHKASPAKLEELAGKLLNSKPKEALELYKRVLTAMISQGHNAAYRQACDLLLKLSAEVGKTAGFKRLLKELAAEFKAKRNMLGLLKEHFSELL